MTYLLFFITILYYIYLNKDLFQILQISAFVFLKFYRSPVDKSSVPIYCTGSRYLEHGDNIICKNWLIKAFSNEIKSRTFSRVWPGFYLFWLIKRNTVHNLNITNTNCLWFSYIFQPKINPKKYRAPLQSLGLFLLISSRISDFKWHSY
jgi:hypothetical protein